MESLFPFFHKILLLDKIEQFIAIPFSRNGKKWSKFIKSIDFQNNVQYNIFERCSRKEYCYG